MRVFCFLILFISGFAPLIEAQESERLNAPQIGLIEASDQLVDITKHNEQFAIAATALNARTAAVEQRARQIEATLLSASGPVYRLTTPKGSHYATLPISLRRSIKELVVEISFSRGVLIEFPFSGIDGFASKRSGIRIDNDDSVATLRQISELPAEGTRVLFRSSTGLVVPIRILPKGSSAKIRPETPSELTLVKLAYENPSVIQSRKLAYRKHIEEATDELREQWRKACPKGSPTSLEQFAATYLVADRRTAAENLASPKSDDWLYSFAQAKLLVPISNSEASEQISDLEPLSNGLATFGEIESCSLPPPPPEPTEECLEPIDWHEREFFYPPHLTAANVQLTISSQKVVELAELR